MFTLSHGQARIKQGFSVNKDALFVTHSKYTAHLQETRKEKAKEKEGNKRNLLQEELTTVKRKKLELETVVSSLQQDIEKYSIESCEKEDLKEMEALIIKANSFRTTVKEKLTINDLEKVSQKLEDEIKSF